MKTIPLHLGLQALNTKISPVLVKHDDIYSWMSAVYGRFRSATAVRDLFKRKTTKKEKKVLQKYV